MAVTRRSLSFGSTTWVASILSNLKCQRAAMVVRGSYEGELEGKWRKGEEQGPGLERSERDRPSPETCLAVALGGFPPARRAPQSAIVAPVRTPAAGRTRMARQARTLRSVRGSCGDEGSGAGMSVKRGLLGKERPCELGGSRALTC